MFKYWIGFAVYTQVDESETKTSRFGHVSGDSESGISTVGTLNPKAYECGELCRVNDFLSNPAGSIFSACELLSLPIM